MGPGFHRLRQSTDVFAANDPVYVYQHGWRAIGVGADAASISRLRDAYLEQILCIAYLQPEYLVLGPVSDDPKQFDLLAKRVMPNFA